MLRLEHYLDVLQRKPGAVRHARVVAQLGPVVTRYRDVFLQARPDAYGEFVRVLLLVRTYPWNLVLQAMRLATERRIYSAEGVAGVLAECRGVLPATPALLPSGPRVQQPEPGLFDALLRMVAR